MESNERAADRLQRAGEIGLGGFGQIYIGYGALYGSKPTSHRALVPTDGQIWSTLNYASRAQSL